MKATIYKALFTAAALLAAALSVDAAPDHVKTANGVVEGRPQR